MERYAEYSTEQLNKLEIRCSLDLITLGNDHVNSLSPFLVRVPHMNSPEDGCQAHHGECRQSDSAQGI